MNSVVSGNFYMVRVTDDNVNEWIAHSREHNNFGATPYFRESIAFYSSANLEIFVAFATPNLYANNREIRYENIDAFVSVTIPTDAPFVSHMGISCYGPREGYYGYGKPNAVKLSIQLHSFIGDVVQHYYPDKKYMLTKPTSQMRFIFTKALNKYDPNHDTYRIGDNEVTKIDTDYAHTKDIIHDMEYNYNPSQCIRPHSERYYCRRQELEGKKPFVYVHLDRENFENTTLELHDENDNIIFKASDGEESAAWFMHHGALNPLDREDGYFCVTIDSLASLNHAIGNDNIALLSDLPSFSQYDEKIDI
jgi:hypothetical protein